MGLLSFAFLEFTLRPGFSCFLAFFPVQAVLAGTMFLQGFLNFCAGSFVLDYMMKWGLVSKSVYRVHIKTR